MGPQVVRAEKQLQIWLKQPSQSAATLTRQSASSLFVILRVKKVIARPGRRADTCEPLWVAQQVYEAKCRCDLHVTRASGERDMYSKVGRAVCCLHPVARLTTRLVSRLAGRHVGRYKNAESAKQLL